MIKRRFYKHDHGDRDVPSDSSSSSDSELEAEPTEETEEEDDVVAKVRENNGYESEDSSGHEVDLDSSGLPTNEDDLETGDEGQNVSKNLSSDKSNAGIVDVQCNTKAKKIETPSDVSGCVLKSKTVFKCKLCPRIVCLTEETLRTHLKSKRHARSEKLLSEGRLKFMLNSDGEIEGETHQERHASTLAAAQSCQNPTNSKKKNKGRQRQRKRVKKKAGEDFTSENTKSTKRPPRKRGKSNN